VSLINLARSEAIRRSGLVEMDLEETADGWEASVRVHGAVEPLRTATNTGVRLDHGLGDALRTLVFNSRGYLVEVGSDTPQGETQWDTLGATLHLEHVDCTTKRHHRKIQLLPTGQLNASNVDCAK